MQRHRKRLIFRCSRPIAGFRISRQSPSLNDFMQLHTFEIASFEFKW